MKRHPIGNPVETTVPAPLELLHNSYMELMQPKTKSNKRRPVGLQGAFQSIFPVTGINGTSTVVVDFVRYNLGKQKYNKIEQVMASAGTWGIPLQVVFRVTVYDKDGVLQHSAEQPMDFGEFPLITPEGNFIINGIYKVVISQTIRAPGPYIGRGQLQIISEKGPWISVTQDRQGRLQVSINRQTKKFPLTQLFVALGKNVGEILSSFYEILVLTKGDNGWETEFIPGEILDRDLIDAKTKQVLAPAGTPASILKKYKGRKIIVSLEDMVGQFLADGVTLVSGNTQRELPSGTQIKETHLRRLDNLNEFKVILVQGDPSIFATWSRSKDRGLDIAKDLGKQILDPELFSIGNLGRKRLNQKLGQDSSNDMTISCQELIDLTKQYLEYLNGSNEIDSIDHLGNRQILLPGQLIASQFRQGLQRIEPIIREKIKSADLETIQPGNILDPRPVVNLIKEFFNSSELVQYMEQTNPLSALVHCRRISSSGPGGIKRAGAEARDVHPSHYGRICPIETPEGGNIGLVTSLASFAKIDELGRLVTPYRKVEKGKINGEIIELTADQEQKYVIASADNQIDNQGRFTEQLISSRHGGESIQSSPQDINLVDYDPGQSISLSASLIPFIANDDANRALMGSNMQRQAVPLLNPSAPIIGTGMEEIVAQGSGAIVKARRSGTVVQIDAQKIIIRTKAGKIDSYYLTKFQRSNKGTCINQKPMVSLGDQISKGQTIINGPAADQGELALGQNILVAFMPWYGYNFEDSILVSEKVVQDDLFTSIHIEQFETLVRETTQGVEEITRDIPNVAQHRLRHLDESGIVYTGTHIKSNDIIVGKVAPKGEEPSSAEDQLLQTIFGEKASSVRDVSMKMPPGSNGTVISVQVLQNYNDNDRSQIDLQTKHQELKTEHDMELKVIDRDLIEQVLEQFSGYRSVSGKLKGKRITNDNAKNLSIRQLKSLEIRDQPRMDKVRVLWDRYETYKEQLETLYQQRLENLTKTPKLPPGVVKSVRVMVAVKRTLSPGDKMSGRHGNKGVISKIVSVADMPFLEDGRPVDIVLNPLGVPSRMNVGQILETHLGWAVSGMGNQIGKIATAPFSGATESDINKMLEQSGLCSSGQEILRDGCTGEKIDRPVTVGYMYMMKLHHLVDEKIHARSIGPYSAITQQPLGGKSNNGGQRLGEMEVWALEAYGAAHTLHEMLTVKSDDLIGRQKTYHAIISGEPVSNSTTPESFKVLVNELKALALDVSLEKSKKGSNFDFDSIKVRLASSEKIKSWSFGQVLTDATINYRTLKPEPDGLFCTKVFGPVKDYECLCGRYKRIKYQNTICQNCGTPVTLSRVRRERMGHIELAVPIVHKWFLKSQPYYISTLLGIPVKKLERLSNYEIWIVINPGLTTCVHGDILEHEELLEIYDMYGGPDCMIAQTGGRAIKNMLDKIDLQEIKKSLEDTQSIQDLTSPELKRLKLVRELINSKIDPTDMVLTVLPVLPADLRPLIPLEGGRFATSDLNDLYKVIINRNNRLTRFLEIRAPDLLVNRESRLLQESINNLFDNRSNRTRGRRRLKSLGERLKGKSGRFRQNLLGKRVDYSGRSVITVGPNLELYQCGLPKKMALELFRPFIYGELRQLGLASNNKSARILVDHGDEKVWEILDKVVHERPVLLNRAPTLHRLGIQAFEPKLVEDKAIQLHPLVCTAFNADFDGDQMAVHVPLSDEACREAKELMLSTNNILNPANGRPIINPSQDMVLGLYYLSLESIDPQPEIICSDITEATMLWARKTRNLHDPIKLRTKQGILDTTVGRSLLFKALPDNPDIDYTYANQIMTSRKISQMINHVYLTCGRQETVKFIDLIMKLGFEISTISGISFGKNDLLIPENKKEILDHTQSEINNLNEQYQMGMIQAADHYNQVIEKWMKCSDKISEHMMELLQDPSNGYNSIYIMADSGARGSPAQIKQLAGMRGLMVKPTGEIITTPITSNFKEGLTALEYFNSTHGSRKGLVDTALKTSDSGYLTRRLVDVAQDVIITKKDCGRTTGIEIEDIVDSGNVLIPLEQRLIGRTLVKPIIDPATKKELFPEGTMLTIPQTKIIQEAGIRKATIRSVLTCKLKKGVCATCYGLDLAHGRPAVVGEAVGVIAAQSIGEPGTQLTLRTFHVGGTAQRTAKQSTLVADYDGNISIQGRTVTNRHNQIVVIDRNAHLVITNDQGEQLVKHRLSYGSTLFQEEGMVLQGDTLATWDPFTQPIISEVEGIVKYRDLIEDVSLKQSFDPNTGLTNTIVSEWNEQQYSLQPRIKLCDLYGKTIQLSSGVVARYNLYPETTILVKQNQTVKVGDIIARMPVEATRSSDITGGLLRIQDLFEMRTVKDHPAVFARNEGKVQVGPSIKNTRTIEITREDGIVDNYMVNSDQIVLVQDGDFIKTGTMLVEGEPCMQDIFQVFGINYFATYMIREIQKIYRMQGIEINDKHIEIILRQMLQKVKIVDPGNSNFIVGELIDAGDWRKACKRGDKVIAQPVVQGITAASLQTKSFIAAASFQETIRILSEAALLGRSDELFGPKENIIAGRVPPIGTGLNENFASDHSHDTRK